MPSFDPASLSRRVFLRTAATAGAGATALLAFGCGPTGRPEGGVAPPVDGVAAVPPVDPAAIERFRSTLRGTAIVPGDAVYDSARRVASFNPLTDKRPALIVRCAGDDDVARSVGFGRANGLEIAVRGGGHDVLGASVCEGGLVIDLAEMTGLRIDTQRRTATAQPGLRAGGMTSSLATRGLAAALGCNPEVGISGLTLGGGLGWLLGRFGAACDNLLGAELVTADGRKVRAGEDLDPELLWGLRGGGGNFGVVTRLEYRLHPVSEVVGGYLAFPDVRLGDFLDFYGGYMAQAPDELAVELVWIHRAPPVVIAIVCFSGDRDAAERVVAPLRGFSPRAIDGLAVTPLWRIAEPPPEIARFFDGDPGEGPAGSSPAARPAEPRYAYWKGDSLRGLPAAAIEVFAERAAEAGPGWALGLGHYLHGEICRVDPATSPLPRPEGSYCSFFNAFWSGDAGTADAMAWVDRSIEAVAPFSGPGGYINYLSSDAEPEVRASYGDAYPRLAALKRRFDPDNVFHLNRNVRPG